MFGRVFLYPNLEERQVKSMVYTLYKPKLWGYLKGGFLYRVNFFYTKAINIMISVVLGALVLAGLYLLFGSTVLPLLSEKIKAIFNYQG